MATGDLAGNIRKLQGDLKNIKYPHHLDAVG
jgi:hypothetical protein